MNLLSIALIVLCQQTPTPIKTEEQRINAYIKWAEARRVSVFNAPELDAIRLLDDEVARLERQIQSIKDKKRKPVPKKKPYGAKVTAADLQRLYSQTDPPIKDLEKRMLKCEADKKKLLEKIEAKGRRAWLPSPTDTPNYGRYTEVKGVIARVHPSGDAVLVRLGFDDDPQTVVLKGIDTTTMIDGQNLRGEPFFVFDETMILGDRKVLVGHYLDKVKVFKKYQEYIDNKNRNLHSI